MASATQTTDGTDPDTPMIAVAFHAPAERVYVHRGPNTQPYPIEFTDPTDGETLEVESDWGRIRREAMFGFIFHAAPQDSSDGQELAGLVEDIQNGDDMLDAVKRRLAALRDGDDGDVDGDTDD